MLGSYPPQEAVQEVVWPRHGWEEAPSGMLARGSYKSTIKFIDDDDVTHLQFDYGFSIKKGWGKDKEYVLLSLQSFSHFISNLFIQPFFIAGRNKRTLDDLNILSYSRPFFSSSTNITVPLNIDKNILNNPAILDVYDG